MITWTTYGSWVQGDSRGFVKEGKIHPGNKKLANLSRRELSQDPVKLSKIHRQQAANAIFEKARKLNQKICALWVSSNHIHIVTEYTATPISEVVKHYKNAAQVALREMGLKGRIWTKGFDKRYCFDKKSLQNRINYINSHNKDI